MSALGGIDIAWLAQQFPDLSELTELKVGGQKAVFAANHRTDGAVVLKIIHPQQDLEMTKREIIATQQLSSKRVPQVLEAAFLKTQLGDCVWFRETRVLGETIGSKLERGSFNKVELLKLGLQTLDTLVAAEQFGIVHRDIKPDNLMLDESGNFWLIDFGVSRHLTLNSLTGTSDYFGKCTLGYAPPEQFRNKKRDIDARCDLFALGVTLYQCATGTHPFRDGARDHSEILRRVETTSLPRLKLNFKNSGQFADLVSAMTQTRRDHRPATAKEAYEWIKQVCDDEAVF